MYSGKYNLEHRYRTRLEWTSVNADCGKLRIVGKKTAAPRTHADSEALTEQNAADTYRKLKARLVALGIGQWVSGESNAAGVQLEIKEPGRVWFMDEKGFNDEGLASSIGLASAGNKQVSTGHSRSVPHISVLTSASAAGDVARPAVIVPVVRMHDDLLGVITASTRGHGCWLWALTKTVQECKWQQLQRWSFARVRQQQQWQERWQTLPALCPRLA